MGKSFKVSLRLRTIMIMLGIVILLMLFWSGFGTVGPGCSTSDLLGEIDRRGWRVLYLKQTGNHLVAICGAGANKMAVMDTEWPSKGFSSLNIMDSEHHGISAGGLELFTCDQWFHRNRVVGAIVPIKLPSDGRIRIVHQAGFFVRGETRSGGEILLDVEVDWNAHEPMQEP